MLPPQPRSFCEFNTVTCFTLGSWCEAGNRVDLTVTGGLQGVKATRTLFLGRLAGHHWALGAELWELDAGLWALGAGRWLWMLGTGRWELDAGRWALAHVYHVGGHLCGEDPWVSPKRGAASAEYLGGEQPFRRGEGGSVAILGGTQVGLGAQPLRWYLKSLVH